MNEENGNFVMILDRVILMEKRLAQLREIAKKLGKAFNKEAA